MKTLFRPDTTFSLAGILWIYIFVSLLFFGNHTTQSKKLSHSENTTLHNYVLSTSEYQQATAVPDIFVKNDNIHLTFNSDDGTPDEPATSQSTLHPVIKSIIAYSHLPLKNSPNTIRMITSVLRV